MSLPLSFLVFFVVLRSPSYDRVSVSLIPFSPSPQRSMASRRRDARLQACQIMQGVLAVVLVSWAAYMVYLAFNVTGGKPRSHQAADFAQ